MSTAAENNLTIDVSTQAEAVILSLSGELDVASASELESCLAEAEESAPAKLIVDLRELAFMDSTGLRTVLAGHERATVAGREFGLVRGPEQVQRLLTLTRVAERLVIVDEPAEMLVSS